MASPAMRESSREPRPKRPNWDVNQALRCYKYQYSTGTARVRTRCNVFYVACANHGICGSQFRRLQKGALAQAGSS